MKNKTQNEIHEQNIPEASRGISTDGSAKPGQLSDDQDFSELREAYQEAEFNRCRELLVRLDKRFPEHPTLRKYREEIEIRQSIKMMSHESKKVEKRNKKKKHLRLVLFAIISTLLVVVVFVYSYFYFNIKVSAKQLEEESSLLMELDGQVNQLLLVGKPRDAAEVLNQIRVIDASYEGLSDLELKTYELLVLDEKYISAMGLMDLGETDAALTILLEIENAWPGLWDVRQKINTLENLN